ncbi:serine/threonine protein phosphatase [Nocardia niigatensis]|uniref:serine/threonine protein phosphatase n=1 Tax=Nocardia niigatensis TaxID=209249 RepID=UPI00031FEF44|nr:serine/threonine protein phosphatase [Nocardia niigatensis]
MLASHGDLELTELMDAGRPDSVGVGGSSAVLDVDGVPVFVKRIPLTDRELTRRASTANLFDLPLFCQYGIGGPSFNAWRELAANSIVTDAVLACETQSFPMLYHWRVLPGRPPVAAEHADIDTVVAAQGGSPAVRARLAALAAARCSLVLFCEYIPLTMADWLRENPVGKAVLVEQQLSEIVMFLRDHQLLHMDGHFGNMRSDGERIYLSDFGLATSPRFDLSTAERDFVERHATHDADYAAMRLVNWLVTEVCGIPMPTSGGPVARNEYVLQCAAGHIPDDVPPAVAEILTQHAPAAATMNAFYWRLFAGEIHTEYPSG